MPSSIPSSSLLPSLHLAAPLHEQLWQHAVMAAPKECVGFLGGCKGALAWQATVLCPLDNIALRPEVEYLAQPQGVLRALSSFARQGLELVGIYHSHPRGPAYYSTQDKAQAGYDVPYLIADLSGQRLVAYWLPAGVGCGLVIGRQ